MDENSSIAENLTRARAKKIDIVTLVNYGKLPPKLNLL